MSEIEVIEKPGHDGKRTALVLAEDRIGHYPEFREFFIRRFLLETNGLSRSGYIRGPSGTVYSLVFVGRSGEPFPDGLEVYALVGALEPLTLQLPFFEVMALSFRLVGSAPERPCDDVCGLNPLLSESDGDAADFLD